MKNSTFLSIVLLMGALSVFSLANAQTPVGVEKNNGIVDVKKKPDQLLMMSKDNARNVTFTIKGPDGLYSQEFLGDSSLSLNSEDISELKDGVYSYEFTGSSDKLKKRDYKDTLNHGRKSKKSANEKSAKMAQYEPVSQSGTIVIKNGQIVVEEVEEQAYTGDK